MFLAAGFVCVALARSSPGWPQAALGAFGVLLAVWLYRIPSRERP